MDFDAKVKSMRLNEMKRHIFLCAGPKCCATETGDRVWNSLKAKLKDPRFSQVLRTKVHCLRICQKGPIALVYPEGAWYKSVDEEACDRIAEKHLLLGEGVKENLISTC